MNPASPEPSKATPATQAEPARGLLRPLWLRLTATVLLTLVLLLATLFVVAATFDWNRARPWIEQQVSQATGRTLKINGDLELQWHRGGKEEGGWRGWVPWPQLKANDLQFGNADWSQSGKEMAELRSLSISLSPLPLMQHTIRITELELDGPQVLLERQADGRNNWTFDSLAKDDTVTAQRKPWGFEVERLILKKGGLRYDDKKLRMDFNLALDTIDDATGPYGVRWKLDGTYRKAKLEGEGQAGQVLDLTDKDTPFPIQAKVRAGRTRALVEGTLLRPTSLAGMDLKLQLSGQSMADLYDLTGVTLPKTAPYTTQGQLVGRLTDGQKSWTYREFTGKMGSSDIAGTLEYLMREPRPLLRGQVRSKLLRFDDLGPLIGAGPSSSQSEFEEKKEKQPGDRVLPVVDFDTDSWGAMDADVVVDGDRIVRDEDLPINSLHAKVKLDNKVLSLTPLNFGVAGGTLGSDIKLDARSGTIAADTRMRIKALQLSKLFPKLDSTRASLGQLNGSVALSGKGNDIATLLGGSNGEIRALISQGTFSKLVLEAMGLNIANVVMTRLFGDEQIQLNCLAARFDVKNGLMKTEAFVLDTTETRVEVAGTVNLKNEAINLDMVPHNKKLRLLSLRAPLHVRGDFADPAVSIDAPTVALKLGAAAALAAAAPIAALLPLTSLNLGDDEEFTGCRDLLRAASGKAQAPKAR